MSSTHNIDYKGKQIKITVSNTGHGKYIGTYVITETDPPMRGETADATSEEDALSVAERHAKAALDARGTSQEPRSS